MATMIREIRGNDAPGVVAVWNRVLVRDPTTEAQFARWLFADPDFDVENGKGAWVAEMDGEIVGFIRAAKRLQPNDYAGTEPDLGWIPAMFVAPEQQRQGIGTALLEKAVEFLKGAGTKQIWLCGNTGSAPGYIFPGVDKDVYASGVAFFRKHGFVIDHEPISMSGSLLDFDATDHLAAGGEKMPDLMLGSLAPETVMDYLAFLRRVFPGDWNLAARNKIKSGAGDEILVAQLEGRVVGYCQWDSDGHFGPFGVDNTIRNKGLGRVIFAEACRRMKAAGVRNVWFNWADEDVARFYRRFGLEATRHFAIMRRDL